MKQLLLFVMLLVMLPVGAQTTINLKLTGGKSVAMRQNVEKNIANLFNEINRAYKNSDDLNFSTIKITEDARENIESMWDFNAFYCMQNTINEAITNGQLINTYELRNIPIAMVEGESEGEKRQEIAVEFNEKGEITDLYFSLQQYQFKNIMATGNDVIAATQKNIIRGFLENMKTAYMRKDINFIGDMFSDKALIVVGKQIKQTDKKSLSLNATQKELMFNDPGETQFKKLTKEQYLNNLRSVFKNNKSISVDFDDIEIVQHLKKGYEAYYGVRLKQDWRSDKYSDEGLLFFVIEFREKEDPLIWVRVWQDANTTDKSQQIGLGEIKIKPNGGN